MSDSTDTGSTPAATPAGTPATTLEKPGEGLPWHRPLGPDSPTQVTKSFPR